MRNWEQLSYYSTWAEMGFVFSFFCSNTSTFGPVSIYKQPSSFFFFFFAKKYSGLEYLELKQNTTLHSEITSQKGCLNQLGDGKITKNLHVPGSYCVDFCLGN